MRLSGRQDPQCRVSLLSAHACSFDQPDFEGPMLMPMTRLDARFQALRALQAKDGGIIRDGKLYPPAPPEPKLSAIRLVPDVPRKWHVINSEPQHEKTAADALEERGFDVYHPELLRVVAHGRGRVRQVTRPMFPGYLFVHFSRMHDRWGRIFSTVGVRGILMSGAAPAEVSVAAIDGVRRREAEEAADFQRKHKPGDKTIERFRAGELVQVKEGPFEHLLAHVAEANDSDRVMILMQMLGGETKVKLSADVLKRVDELANYAVG
jgi:transcriptional antiterminator RfaH